MSEPPRVHPPRLILVGEITRPHGIRGGLLVRPATANPSRFSAGARLLFGRDEASVAPREVLYARPQGANFVVGLEGVGDRSAAEGMRGMLIFVTEDALGELGPDEFWPHQLEGLEVYDAGGARVGRLARVLSRREQDLWEVDTGDGAVLVPAAKDLVRSVDLPGGRVVVDLPEGLADLGEP